MGRDGRKRGGGMGTPEVRVLSVPVVVSIAGTEILVDRAAALLDE